MTTAPEKTTLPYIENGTWTVTLTRGFKLTVRLETIDADGEVIYSGSVEQHVGPIGDYLDKAREAVLSAGAALHVAAIEAARVYDCYLSIVDVVDALYPEAPEQ